MGTEGMEVSTGPSIFRKVKQSKHTDKAKTVGLLSLEVLIPQVGQIDMAKTQNILSLGEHSKHL